jgi:adenylate kinase family enzyme
MGTLVYTKPMKIMIFGDSSAGKSTFAKKLGERMQLDVLHLDEVMDKIGRQDKAVIGEYIATETSKAKWIMDGNAFTKDKHARIEAADLIIVFDINRFKALTSHVGRYVKLKTGLQKKATGGHSTQLNLPYFIPYILWQFPGRKKAAIAHVQKAGKQVRFIKNFKQADKLIDELARHDT